MSRKYRVSRLKMQCMCCRDGLKSLGVGILLQATRRRFKRVNNGEARDSAVKAK